MVFEAPGKKASIWGEKSGYNIYSGTWTKQVCTKFTPFMLEAQLGFFGFAQCSTQEKKVYMVYTKFTPSFYQVYFPTGVLPEEIPPLGKCKLFALAANFV